MWQRTCDRKGSLAVSALTTFLAASGGDLVDEAVLGDETVFPPPAKLEKLQVANPSPAGERLRNRIWTELKAA
jgi:hypothetical protein